MLVNGTMVRVDKVTGRDATGEAIRATGETIAVRCCVTSVTAAHRITLGAVLEDATRLVSVGKAELAAAGDDVEGSGPEGQLAHGDRVTIVLDNETTAQ